MKKMNVREELKEQFKAFDYMVNIIKDASEELNIHMDIFYDEPLKDILISHRKLNEAIYEWLNSNGFFDNEDPEEWVSKLIDSKPKNNDV